MTCKNLFDTFDLEGRLLLPDGPLPFGEIPWSKHAAFQGVELKHIVTSAQTGGQFSYHLVRIAPNCAIGEHTHQEQLETHEVIAGAGQCLNGGVRLSYRPGAVAILPKGVPHEVIAGPEGLCLFAKFIPALV